MDMALCEQHLAAAKRHVAQGQRLVTQQRQLVQELERHELNSAVARDFLTTLEETLSLHSADRDRLRKELGFGQSEK